MYYQINKYPGPDSGHPSSPKIGTGPGPGHVRVSKMGSGFPIFIHPVRVQPRPDHPGLSGFGPSLEKFAIPNVNSSNLFT